MTLAMHNTMLFKQKWEVRRVFNVKWWLRGIILGFIVGLVVSVSYAALPTAKEYQVKAVYLFNFSKFIRWPDSAFGFDNARPIRICVLGKNPFENFARVVRGKKIKGRPVRVLNLRDFRNSRSCHILFVSKSEEGHQAAILNYTRQYPILTVSDIKRFVTRGGMIQFYIRSNKVRFMIDPRTLREVGISASANLLRVAKIVR
jgi:hypothetical protein